MLQVIKIGKNRFISRRLARDTERDMYSYGKSLHASRFSLAVCLQHYHFKIVKIHRHVTASKLNYRKCQQQHKVDGRTDNSSGHATTKYVHELLCHVT